MLTISAKTRTNETPAALRAAEQIPAVYYGSGKAAVAVTVPAREFLKVWKEAGETTTVTLDLGNEKVTTLIHDMQLDPVTDAPTHVDFLVVDMNKEIEVGVPIEFTGLAEAEKAGLGTLVKVLHEVEVRALPANLPHDLVVDVSGLATLDAQIHAKDIVLPAGVTMVTDAEEVIALIAPFVEEKESAPMDLSSIEVEKKGKVEEEAAPTE